MQDTSPIHPTHMRTKASLGPTAVRRDTFIAPGATLVTDPKPSSKPISGLSTSDQIAIGVGIPGGIIALCALLVAVDALRDKRQLDPWFPWLWRCCGRRSLEQPHRQDRRTQPPIASAQQMAQVDMNQPIYRQGGRRDDVESGNLYGMSSRHEMAV